MLSEHMTMKIRQAHHAEYGFNEVGEMFMVLMDSRGNPFAMATFDIVGVDELAEFIDAHGFDYIGEVAGHA